MNFTTQSTTAVRLDEAPFLSLTAFLSFIDFSMNTALAVVLYARKLDRESNRFVFITELSFFNAFVGLAMFIDVFLQLHFPDQFSNLLCKVISILAMYGVFGSSLNMTVMVLDHYFLIAYPLKYPVLLTYKKATIIIFGIFFACIAWSVITGVMWNDLDICDYVSNLPAWHHMISICFGIILPLVVFVVIQILTVCIARRHMKQILAAGNNDNSQDGQLVRRHWNGVVFNGMMTTAVVVSWMPLLVLNAFYMTLEDPLQNLHFLKFSAFAETCYQLNGVWLPIIYAVKSPEIKRIIAQLKNKFRRSNIGPS